MAVNVSHYKTRYSICLPRFFVVKCTNCTQHVHMSNRLKRIVAGLRHAVRGGSKAVNIPSKARRREDPPEQLQLALRESHSTRPPAH